MIQEQPFFMDCSAFLTANHLYRVLQPSHDRLLASLLLLRLLRHPPPSLPFSSPLVAALLPLLRAACSVPEAFRLVKQKGVQRTLVGEVQVLCGGRLEQCSAIGLSVTVLDVPNCRQISYGADKPFQAAALLIKIEDDYFIEGVELGDRAQPDPQKEDSTGNSTAEQAQKQDSFKNHESSGEQANLSLTIEKISRRIREDLGLQNDEEAIAFLLDLVEKKSCENLSEEGVELSSFYSIQSFRSEHRDERGLVMSQTRRKQPRKKECVKSFAAACQSYSRECQIHEDSFQVKERGSEHASEEKPMAVSDNSSEESGCDRQEPLIEDDPDLWKDSLRLSAHDLRESSFTFRRPMSAEEIRNAEEAVEQLLVGQGYEYEDSRRHFAEEDSVIKYQKKFGGRDEKRGEGKKGLRNNAVVLIVPTERAFGELECILEENSSQAVSGEDCQEQESGEEPRTVQVRKSLQGEDRLIERVESILLEQQFPRPKSRLSWHHRNAQHF